MAGASRVAAGDRKDTMGKIKKPRKRLGEPTHTGKRFTGVSDASQGKTAVKDISRKNTVGFDGSWSGQEKYSK